MLASSTTMNLLVFAMSTTSLLLLPIGRLTVIVKVTATAVAVPARLLLVCLPLVFVNVLVEVRRQVPILLSTILKAMEALAFHAAVRAFDGSEASAVEHLRHHPRRNCCLHWNGGGYISTLTASCRISATLTGK